MGTTTDRGHTKKTVTTMTQMFRGLLDILHQNRSDLHQSLNLHIRSFDRKTDQDELDLGVTGFWSLMLELVFNCYTQTVLAVGITLVMLLSLITYPVRFVVYLLGNTFFRQARPLTEDELRMYHAQQQAFNEAMGIGKKDPITEAERKDPKIEDDGKVVRRVVYEETKVKK
jgi:hypothetical protein